jgi:hypothetical protein
MSSLPSYTVRTATALNTALARSTGTRIVLGASIPVSTEITIPDRHTIVTGGYGFQKQGSGRINFHGTLEDEHRQVFFGFNPGDVTGLFRSQVARPVWWGAYARTANLPASNADTRDDIGINCAIQSVLPDNAIGRKVVLDTGAYHVGRPIDISGRNILLEGAGPSRSHISTTSFWTADWKTDPMYGASSHGAVIWVGSSSAASVSSFNSSVRGVHVNGYYAAIAPANLSKRVSGISSYGWMEEHTAIEDVTIEYFSGYGVGCTSKPGMLRVMNGFALKKFWITGGLRVDCCPVAVGEHSAAACVRDGTIDMNPGIGDQARPVVRTAIWAQGQHTIIENIHVEWVRNAVLVRGGVTGLEPQGQSVEIRGVDLLRGVDHDMAQTGRSDPVTTTQLPVYSPTSTDYDDIFKWSTVLVIAGSYSDLNPYSLVGRNGTDTGVAEPIAYHPRVVASSLSGNLMKYLVRDYGMGQHIQAWRTEQLGAHYGMIARYVRSNVYATGATAVPYWEPSVPGGPRPIGTFPTDKTYVEKVI